MYTLATVSDPSLPLSTRLWFAFVCFFRVLFNGVFAARALEAAKPTAALPPAPREPQEAEREPESVAKPIEAPVEAARDDSALQLLALLQREGRLVDFLQQDISAFSDADIGSAARVVHEGCRRALQSHVRIVPVRSEHEGATLMLAADYDPNEVKLTGDVHGSAPYRGVLRHRGWRAESVQLPHAVGDVDLRVLAPAEVEL